MKRNNDFYGEGEFISSAEASDYLKFVEDIFHLAEKEL